MVEFALVVTFIFLLIVGILQMILLMHAYNTLADSAKEGVRYAIVHGTGLGAANCSGPGTAPSTTPSVACTNDATGSVYVKPQVMAFAGLSFQNINPATDITVDYDPGTANSSNPVFSAACSQPGCLVRVTVRHTYTPLFVLGWPRFRLNAAADGRITN